MPLDYSKWDNLELSDDSDIESHPNIEKGTFIRLRQRKIREDRENRRMRRERILATIDMNNRLIERLNSARDNYASASAESLKEAFDGVDKEVELAREQKQAREAAAKAGTELEPPSDGEMVNALLARIEDDLHRQSATKLDTVEARRDAYVGQISQHLEKLRQTMVELERELGEVRREEAKHVSVDSIVHEGFNRTIVSKSNSSTAAAAAASASGSSTKTATRTEKQTVTTEEVLNPASVGKHKDSDDVSDEIDDNGDLKLDDDAKAFAILKSMSDSMDYIRKHLSVITEKKADQILGHAFTLELAGKHALSLQYVRQSLILTYILQMGASGVNVFFSRIGAKGPAQDMFEKDVESRYKHIVGRCKVIKSEDQESDEQQVESIQLQCDDPTAPIRMSVPDESDESEDPARVELFKQLPESLQSALSEGTLDAVNKVLADIPGPEAERLLAICGQGGFLVIDGEIVVDPSNEAESSTKE